MKDSDKAIQDLGYNAHQVQAIQRLTDIRRQPVGFAMGFVTTLPISKSDQGIVDGSTEAPDGASDASSGQPKRD